MDKEGLRFVNEATEQREGVVADPLIYVGTHTIKPGMLDTAKTASRELVEFVESNHPRMIHFEVDIDDDANEMTVIQVHPDDESLLFHVQLAAERIKGAYEFLDATTKIEIYGTPGDQVIGLLDQMRGEAPVRLNIAVAGFSRLG